MSSPPRRLIFLLTAPACALFLLLPAGCGQQGGTAPGAAADGYLFCFWNVEDLFDDKRDKHHAKVDQDFDSRFANNPALLEAKLGNLSKVLLSMNGGKGPDIFAFAEVESERAADLLRQRLNKDLGKKAAAYDNLLFRETRAGRHISTGIITRLPVLRNRTQKLDGPHRILEGHIEVNGHQLVVIASHWTSRVTKGSVEGRAKYAKLIYGRFKAMYKANKDIDFLVCGDFNDNPFNDSVTDHLHAVSDRTLLTAQPDDPRLFSLSASAIKVTAKGDKTDGTERALERFGTLKYGPQWNLFDQFAVSPGLLDNKGWTVVPETLATVRDRRMMKLGKPWKFDTRDKDGYSDHFPVTVRLKVQGKR